MSGPARSASKRLVRLLLIACAALPGCFLFRKSPDKARTVFYPLPPASPRIQYLTAINGSWDVEPKRTALEDYILGGKAGKGVGLRLPYGVATWDAKIYVADHRGSDVLIFDVKNRKFSTLNKGRPILTGPTNLCIDKDGFKFVCETLRQRVHVFGPDDQLVGTYRIEDGRPADVAVVGQELFVTDVANHRLLVLDRATGKVVRTIGERGGELGQYRMPNALATDSEGNVYVVDAFNYRYQKLDSTGKALLAVGRHGDSYGHFGRPRGIAVGPDGVVCVVESQFELVQMFNQKGEVLMMFGKGEVLMMFGKYQGAPYGFLELPAGIAVDTSCLPYFRKYVDPRFDAEYLLFVVSQLGRAKLSVYALGKLKPGVEIPSPFVTGTAAESPAGTEAKPGRPTIEPGQKAPAD
jgi:sugar lactone lactonase YvrE